MRYFSIVLLMAVFGLVTTAQTDGYRLKGKIKGLENGKITLGYYDHDNQRAIVVDSAQIQKGRFELNGNIDYPHQLRASITPGDYSFSIWLENSEISIEGDVAMAKSVKWGGADLPVKISGSAIQDEQNKYDELQQPILDEMAPLSKAYDEANMAYMKGSRAKLSEEEINILKNKAQSAYDALKPFTSRMGNVSLKYMNEHPSSFITASILRMQKSYMPLDEVKQRYDALGSKVQQSIIGQSILADIKKSQKGAPGSQATPFAKNDIKGEPISLADFKGQYVLLDFWASWCKPCRAGNPHLISLYSKYHDKGLEIIGIASDDGNEAAWHKAVKEDEIGIWRHILNGDKRKGESIGDDYAVHSLPTKILIDPTGKIIGRFAADGGTDEEMDKLFESIFGK